MSSRTCNNLNFKNKVEVLKLLQEGKPRKEICAQYNISAATLTRLVKKKNERKCFAESNHNLKKKRKRVGSQESVEKSLLMWFKHMRANNASISGIILKEKAKDFAKVLNVDFEPTNGWLERWKKRENICFKKQHGEKTSADTDGANDFITKVLPDYLKDFGEDCIYNADETGLFFKALPSGTLAGRSEVISGDKIQKNRVTLLFITNMTGTVKQVFMIGVAKNPRCFKNRFINLKYFTNTKAWMTQKIWLDVMTEFNNSMNKSKKKALLLIDNAACHKIPDDVTLNNVTIKYLPANTTSIIQPLDQGIIRSFKAHYRQSITRLQVLHLDGGLSQKEFAKKVDLYQCVQMVNRAGSSVTPETIRNCFCKAGFNINNDVEIVESEEPLASAMQQFVEIDKNVPCYGDLTDAEIIDEILQVEILADDIEIVDNSPVKKQKPTLKDVLNSIDVLKIHFENNAETFAKIESIENDLSIMHYKNMKQKKIDDFFN